MSKPWDIGSPVHTTYSFNILNEELQKQSQGSRVDSKVAEPGEQNSLGETSVNRVMLLPAALPCAIIPRQRTTWRKKVWASLTGGTGRHLIGSLEKNIFHLCGGEVNVRSAHEKGTLHCTLLNLKSWAYSLFSVCSGKCWCFTWGTGVCMVKFCPFILTARAWPMLSPL